MGLEKQSKIQKMLQSWPSGTVGTNAMFSKLEVSDQLLRKYTQSGWIETIGKGAHVKAGDDVSLAGGIYALQEQLNLSVHIGAMAALSMQGMAHYVRMEETKAHLFGSPRTLLPTWFKNRDWGVQMNYRTTAMLPENIGLTGFDEKNYTILISSSERAFLECLYLAPNDVDLVECYHVMEGLTTLRPKLLQLLLEQCSSIKVIRLFLYMADKAGHTWYNRLDQSKFDLGKGIRTITKNGSYVGNFQIVIPEELIAL